MRYWVVVVFIFLGCQGQSQKLYVDQEFSSRCDAYQGIAKFALSLHLTKELKDFEAIHKETLEAYARREEIDHFEARSEHLCEDLAHLIALASEKSAPAFPPDFYAEMLKLFVHKLDPHSFYFTPEESKQFLAVQRNEGFGIGVEFEKRLRDYWLPIHYLIVEEVFPDAAARGLLHEGDRISSIQGKPIAGKRLKEVLSNFPDMADMSLEIEGRTGTIAIPQKAFSWNPVFSKLGYLKIRKFTLGSAEIPKRTVQNLEKEGVEGFLIDVRLNPGGIMSEVVRAVGHMKGAGKVIRTLGNSKKRYPDELNPNREYVTHLRKVTDRPIVILMDQGTASAAEIFAGALAGERAVLIGDRTFGKGTGQNQLPLSSRNGFGGLILLTMFRYEFLDGYSAQARGVAPHLTVIDPLLQKAVEQRKKGDEDSIFVEEDYGAAYIVAPKENPSTLRPSKKIIPDLHEVEPCSETEDCQKKIAFKYLESLTQLH